MKLKSAGAKQRRVAFVVLAGVIVTSGVGWIVGSRVQSPAEAAARTGPPVASPILVPAERRVLSTDVVSRGTARFGSPRQLTVVASALKPDAGIITEAPPVGAELKEGDIVVRASGRPMFLLVGPLPSYRDLGPGLTGDDVRQLEEALGRLGFPPGAVDGVYDNNTASAVARWYEHAGYTPFDATADQLATIRTLEQDLLSGRVELLGARDAVAAAQSDLTAAMNANANAIDARNADPASATAARDADTAAAAVASAQVALTNARAAADLRGVAAQRLSTSLSTQTRRVGAQVPADEVTFVASAPVRVAEVVAGKGQPIAGPALAVTDSTVAIDAALTLKEAPLVKVGMTVKISEPDLGINATGVVWQVATTPGTSGVDAFHVHAEVIVLDSPATLVGTSVRLSIPIKSTGGATLAVPISALSLAADGSSRVQRSHKGALEIVRVKPGLSAGGYVGITVVAGKLAPGELVVIGFGPATGKPGG